MQIGIAEVRKTLRHFRKCIFSNWCYIYLPIKHKWPNSTWANHIYFELLSCRREQNSCYLHHSFSSNCSSLSITNLISPTHNTTGIWIIANNPQFAIVWWLLWQLLKTYICTPTQGATKEFGLTFTFLSSIFAENWYFSHCRHSGMAPPYT